MGKQTAGSSQIWSMLHFETAKNEIFICNRQSSLNMAYQGLTPEQGKIDHILTLMGKDIIGLSLKAPLTKYDVIYSLPMENIKDNKGQ